MFSLQNFEYVIPFTSGIQCPLWEGCFQSEFDRGIGLFIFFLFW